MRSKLLIALGAALLGLGTGWLIGRTPAPKPAAADAGVKTPAPEEAKVPLMPPPRKLGPEWTTPSEEKGKQLPLSKVYTNVAQDNLCRVPLGLTQETLSGWRELRDTLKAVGRATAFVVRAPTILGAIDETTAALQKPRLMTYLPPPLEDESTHLWAFVYLGNAPNTPAWNVDSIRITGSEIWLSYSEVSHAAVTGSSFAHAYWIPLGKMGAETITLHVVDRSNDPAFCEILTTRVRARR